MAAASAAHSRCCCCAAVAVGPAVPAGAAPSAPRAAAALVASRRRSMERTSARQAAALACRASSEAPATSTSSGTSRRTSWLHDTMPYCIRRGWGVELVGWASTGMRAAVGPRRQCAGRRADQLTPSSAPSAPCGCTWSTRQACRASTTSPRRCSCLQRAPHVLPAWQPGRACAAG